MNVVLWIAQGLLAVAYLLAGFMKVSQPIERLSQAMKVPPWFVRFLGIAEVLGAIGLILPMVTGILPWLTVAAAVGLVIVQVGATALHASRREVTRLPVNAVLLLLAAFVVFGRLAVVPA